MESPWIFCLNILQKQDTIYSAENKTEIHTIILIYENIEGDIKDITHINDIKLLIRRKTTLTLSIWAIDMTKFQ